MTELKDVPINIFSRKSLVHANILLYTVPEGNNGCNGGNMYNSYMYVIFNDGVNTEKIYPFEGIVRPFFVHTILFTLNVALTFTAV